MPRYKLLLTSSDHSHRYIPTTKTSSTENDYYDDDKLFQSNFTLSSCCELRCCCVMLAFLPITISSCYVFLCLVSAFNFREIKKTQKSFSPIKRINKNSEFIMKREREIQKIWEFISDSTILYIYATVYQADRLGIGDECEVAKMTKLSY